MVLWVCLPLLTYCAGTRGWEREQVTQAVESEGRGERQGSDKVGWVNGENLHTQGSTAWEKEKEEAKGWVNGRSKGGSAQDRGGREGKRDRCERGREVCCEWYILHWGQLEIRIPSFFVTEILWRKHTFMDWLMLFLKQSCISLMQVVFDLVPILWWICTWVLKMFSCKYLCCLKISMRCLIYVAIKIAVLYKQQ